MNRLSTMIACVCGTALLLQGCASSGGEASKGTGSGDAIPLERVDAADAQPIPASVLVEFETNYGDITIELDGEHAPVSVANFLAYLNEGAYDNTIFHRVMPGFVVQGGGHTADLTELPSKAPIINEWQNGLKNVRGSIGMAREQEPDSATRQFYFNLANNIQLDAGRPNTGNAGYAVFGKVVGGMDVLDRIALVPTTKVKGMENVPVEPVRLIDARVVSDEG